MNKEKNWSFSCPPPGGRTSPPAPFSLEDAVEMDSPDDRRDPPREQSPGVTVVLTHDLESFEPTNALRDVRPDTRQLPILGASLIGQLAAARLAMWGGMPSVPRSPRSAWFVGFGKRAWT